MFCFTFDWYFKFINGNNWCCLPSDEQFKFFEPLFGKKSLTYKNGPEARKKRQLVDRSFGHEAVTHYYDHFTKVLLLLQCSVPILW